MNDNTDNEHDYNNYGDDNHSNDNDDNDDDNTNNNVHGPLQGVAPTIYLYTLRLYAYLQTCHKLSQFFV